MKQLIKSLCALTLTLCGSQQFTSAAEATRVNHPDWSRDAIIYEVNTRQYTPEGTFDAFSAHLPRLKELGVDILWFMPIHPISELNRKGELGSYYAVKDYTGVNPEFGNLDSFKNVVKKAHDLGMKVIIDWVPNHTGCDNAWVKDHPDWYARNDKGEMYGPFDWTDVYQLDYSNKKMRRGMIDALKFWITEVGIDGFRCDVAGRVPVDFWDQARRELEKATGKGNLFMLAEATEPELLDNAFDMDYNWPMKDLQNAISTTQRANWRINPQTGKLDTASVQTPKYAADIPTLVQEQAKTYPAGSYLMNMVTNHDLNSWEWTEQQRYNQYLPAMTVLTYMLPGMPLIYTGQEINMNRALEFFVKDTPVFQAPVKAIDGTPGRTLKVLNTLKHNYRHLDAGQNNILFVPTSDKTQLIIARELPDSDEIVVSALNLGPNAMDISQFTTLAIAPKGYDAPTVLKFGAEGVYTTVDNAGLLPSGQAAVMIIPKAMPLNN